MKLTRDDSALEYYGVPTDWTLLAVYEAGESYSIDAVEIWKTPTGYALLTASGCSCWEGDYETAEFTSLPLLALALFQGESQYQPSLTTALDLLRQVFENE